MILDRIVAVKKDEVSSLAMLHDLYTWRSLANDRPPTRGFERSLRQKAENDEMGLIAEVKKTSPSKGVIREDFDPVQIASIYEQAGAACISVLTDVSFFQGHGSYLRQIRSSVSIPLLRKDFIIDERQIYEARMLDADAILLITAILSPAQLCEYRELAADIGLDVLVEVHDTDELGIALQAGASLVGVNNRDLRDFSVDLETTAKVAEAMPKGTFLVSESGIHSHEDVLTVQRSGAKAILVGESLMRSEDIGKAVMNLIGQGITS